MRRLLLFLVATFVAMVAGVYAHVRLINPNNGNPLYWSNQSNIAITFNGAGSDDIDDGSHMTALYNAVQAWNSIGNTTVNLTEDNSPASQARTDWASDSIHTILFDENNSSGYFPTGSGTVAITPVWFFSNGRIADADILFNGKGFGFTTRGQAGRYDVQDVAVHELGHLLGLDHSGWAGASMYPYVDPSVILHRSLAGDDQIGMRSIYPSGALAKITGTVRRSSNNSVVQGAHIVARDSLGRPAAAALSNSGGVFIIAGLAAGSYTLYASPLDYPVGSFNLGGGWTIQTDFESTEFGNVTLNSGQTQNLGSVLVGANVFLSLGRNSDPYPLRIPSGQSSFISIRGSNLVSGSTLTASDPSISVVPISWFGNRVTATVTVPAGAPIGHTDLIAVNSSGDRSILTAGLEITPPDPTVTLVSPNQGNIEGGAIVSIFGTNFQPGARVVLGGEVYLDGAVGGCTVVNSSTITLTTRSANAGLSDVVVIDASGVEGRAADAFQFIAVPVLNTIFPPSGSYLGGTEVHIVGLNFSDQTQVRINGVNQASVLAVSNKKLVVITTGGTLGGPFLLEVENVGGSVASTQFTYFFRPDPVITAVNPGAGVPAGGELVRIVGSQFGDNLQVRFGANPSTGAGGAVAPELTRLDANTLEVVTPAGSGTVAVILEDVVTGQAFVLGGGFAYASEESGGGGGCHTVNSSVPPNAGDVLRSLLWFALIAVGIRVLGRVARRQHRA